LPALIQLVHTFIRFALPWGCWTRIDCRFGSNLRGVRLFAWETLFPNWGPLPQTSQRLAIIFATSKVLGFLMNVYGITQIAILP